MDTHSDKSRVSRRSFLAAVMGGFGAFIAAAIGAPAIGFSLSPALKNGKKMEWVQAGQTTDFAVGQPQMVEFTIFRKDGWLEESVSKSVWVIRKGDADFSVLSPRCTHLGCMVSYRAEEKAFYCPCHGGIFALTGEVKGGPPPRPLDSLDWKLDGNKLMVSYQDFRLGVPDKTPA